MKNLFPVFLLAAGTPRAAEHKMCIAYQWWCLLVPMEFIIIVCRLAWDTH